MTIAGIDEVSQLLVSLFGDRFHRQQTRNMGVDNHSWILKTLFQQLRRLFLIVVVYDLRINNAGSFTNQRLVQYIWARTVHMVRV